MVTLRANKGYTLIEVVLAIFIFAIVTGLVMMSFTQFLKNKDILQSEIEDLKSLQLGLSVLNNDFRQIIIWPRLNQKNKEDGFYTKNNQLVFSKLGNVNPQFALQRSTLQKVTYTFKGNHLLRTFQDFDSQQHSKKIIKDISNIQVEFIDAQNRTYSIWPPTNDWKNTLPQGLRLSFTHNKYGDIERYFVILPKDTEFVVNEEE